MLLVVFGAGASYDSVDRSLEERPYTYEGEYQPPLANQLFESRNLFGDSLAGFPHLQAVVSRLRHYAKASSGTIEEEMDRLDAESSWLPERHKQLASIRFYLRNVIGECSDRWTAAAWNISNYATLLGLLEAWRHPNEEQVALVTFNYDTLLEQALAGRGILFEDLQAYIQRLDYRLYKVHGSIDWCHPAGLGGTPTNEKPLRDMIERAHNLTISEHFVRSPNRSLLTTETDWLFPALAIPLRKEKRYECPDEHLESLKQDLRRVTKMLVVGWAGLDTHFLSLLHDERCRPHRTLIVCGNKIAAHSTARQLAEAGIESDVFSSTATFSQLVRPHDDQLERLLSDPEAPGG